MKKVLLTGATGFIGRHCLPSLLSRGYEVHAVSLKGGPADKWPGGEWHQADLLNSEQVRALVERLRPTHLLHLAWYAVPGKFWTSLENVRWVQASLDLLQAFAQCEGRRAVMAGSCAEYDWRCGYCSEGATPLSPATLYGVCKHSLQMILEGFAKEKQLSAAWGRIFFLYGPHEPPEKLVAYIIRSLLSGVPARCSHGDQIRDFLYVQDVADALVALLDSDVRGPVNIASGQPIILKELIYTIAEKIGRRDLIQLGATPSPLDEPHLIVANNFRLRDRVGWQPMYGLQTGLDATIEWWQQRLRGSHTANYNHFNLV